MNLRSLISMTLTLIILCTSIVVAEAVSIATHGQHTMALKNDGTLWAWGYNEYGQIGDKTTINRSTPTRVSNIAGVKSIAAGYAHSIALKKDGTLWTWGYNYRGQLGDGTSIDKSEPVQVSGINNDVKAIAAGADHTIALKVD